MESKRHFTDEEHEAMIKAVASGQDVFTEKDVERLLNWIFKVNIDKCFADMILKGELTVDVRGAEFAFKKRENK